VKAGDAALHGFLGIALQQHRSCAVAYVQYH
jgi:hypothetical protein